MYTKFFQFPITIRHTRANNQYILVFNNHYMEQKLVNSMPQWFFFQVARLARSTTTNHGWRGPDGEAPRPHFQVSQPENWLIRLNPVKFKCYLM